MLTGKVAKGLLDRKEDEYEVVRVVAALLSVMSGTPLQRGRSRLLAAYTGVKIRVYSLKQYIDEPVLKQRSRFTPRSSLREMDRSLGLADFRPDKQ